MNEHLYAVIMAGGVGSRLWPRSRAASPKQFLDLLGSRTMLQETVSRIEPLIPLARMLVVVTGDHAETVRAQVPELPPGNILVEPEPRGTAPCIGLAAVMWGGYYGKIQSNTGQGWELLVIAATVIGGCSITGGRGTAPGAFLGSVLIALVYNALVLLDISPYWQNLFVGCLILAAVLIDTWLPAVVQAGRRRKAGKQP